MDRVMLDVSLKQRIPNREIRGHFARMTDNSGVRDKKLTEIEPNHQQDGPTNKMDAGSTGPGQEEKDDEDLRPAVAFRSNNARLKRKTEYRKEVIVIQEISLTVAH